MARQARITFYRRLSQGLGLSLLLLIPILGFFRLELRDKQFILLGERFFLSDLYLLAVFFILLLLVLVLFSRVMGRVFCGWFCPQNTWAELGDHIVKLFARRRKTGRDYLRIGLYALLSLGVMTFFSLTVMAYFLPLRQMWESVVSGGSLAFLSISLTKLTVLGLLNMLIIRHTFCWTVCPYAIFQRFFITPRSLRIAFAEAGCSNCGRCDRACFMKLTPRELDASACINCASCITACERQAARRGVAASLSFALGPAVKPQPGGEYRGGLGRRQGLALLGLVFLGAVFAYGFIHHRTLDVSLNREFVELAEQREGWVTNHYLLRVSATQELSQGLTLAVGKENQIWEDAVLEPHQILPPLSGEKDVELTVSVPATRLEWRVTPINIKLTGMDNTMLVVVRANIFWPES